MIVRTQKIQIKNPNKEIRTILEKNFGFRRWCYNQLLSIWNDYQKKLLDYKNGILEEKPNFPTAWNIRNELRRNTKRPSWFKEYPTQIFEKTAENINNAWKIALSRYEKEKAKNPNAKIKLMKYKTKRKSEKTFSIYKKWGSDFHLKIEKERYFLSLPKMIHGFGRGASRIWIELWEKPKFKQEDIREVTVSFRDGKYWISFVYEKNVSTIASNTMPKRTVGCDWGCKTFLTIGYGSENQRVYEKFDIRKKEIQNIESKISKILHIRDKFCKYNSSRYKKLSLRARLLFKRISNIREDEIKKIVNQLTSRFGTIIIEDIHPQNLKRNHRIARSVSRNSFSFFKRCLIKKSIERGNTVILANMFFPSSQICSKCGNVRGKKTNDKLNLGENIYRCKKCGYEEQRDKNAAYNLKNLKHADLKRAKPLVLNGVFQNIEGFSI